MHWCARHILLYHLSHCDLCFGSIFSTFFSFIQVDISHLKARQTSLQEELQKLHLSSQNASSPTASPAVLPVTTVATTTSSSSFLSQASSAHHGFHSDEVDLSDVLWSQQEINRLSNEVHRLEADVAHWKRVAQVTYDVKTCFTR